MKRLKRIPLLLAALLMLVLPVRAAETVLAECWQGLSSDDALWKECPLGDYAADAVRAGTQAQLALLPAALLGDPLVGDGAITEADLQASFPEDCGIRICRLTGHELKALLEAGVSCWVLTERETLDPEASASGDYLQLSGCTVTLDASAPAGGRFVSMEMDGQPCPLEDSGWTVTAALPETMEIPGEPSGKSLRELTREYLLDRGTVELPEGDRVRVIGAHQRELISYVPPGLLMVVCVLVVAGAVFSRSRGSRS